MYLRRQAVEDAQIQRSPHHHAPRAAGSQQHIPTGAECERAEPLRRIDGGERRLASLVVDREDVQGRVGRCVQHEQPLAADSYEVDRVAVRLLDGAYVLARA